MNSTTIFYYDPACPGKISVEGRNSAMTKSKETILAAIRENKPETTELPSLDHPWQQFDDPVEHFCETLKAVGGLAFRVKDLSEAESTLKQLDCFTQAKKISSRVDGLNLSTFDISAVDDPHQLNDLDLAILPGRFGVAENGAIWIDGKTMPHRVMLFIAQHVVITVPRKQIVHNMHQGYEKLNLKERQFGIFVSGPSKTADIEQSLVIGAHGARSATIFLIENEADE